MSDSSARLCVSGVPVACRPGQVLLEALQSAGRLVASACGGQGACGLCEISVLEGAASPLTPKELRHFRKAEYDPSVRLACQMRLVSNLDIALPSLAPIGPKDKSS